MDGKRKVGVPAARFAVFTALIFALLALVGCDFNRESGENKNSGKTTSVTIVANDPSAASTSGGGLQTFLSNNFTDIAAISITVTDPGSTVLFSGALTQSGSVWIGSIPALPVGPVLTFDATASNGTPEVIFTGSASQVLTGTADVVSITMASSMVSFELPRILAIEVPADIRIATTGTINADIEGGAAWPNLNWAFAHDVLVEPTGGFQGTLSGTANANPATTVSASFLAPDTIPGDPTIYSNNSISVSNDAGATVVSKFPIKVTNGAGQVDPTFLFNPVVYAITAERQYGSNNVVFTASISDDVGIANTNYTWSYAGVSATIDPASATGGGATEDAVGSATGTVVGTLNGYTAAETGNISVTLTDADGGATTVTINLPVGLFPDNIVVPVFDFNSGTDQGFTTPEAGTIWHVTDRLLPGGTRAMWFGDEVSGTVDDGVERGQGGVWGLESPGISTGSTATLLFNARHNNGCAASPCPDNRLVVMASATAGGPWTDVVGEVLGTGAAFAPQTVDLSTYAGAMVYLRFEFDPVVTTVGSSFEGSYIDDVKVVR